MKYFVKFYIRLYFLLFRSFGLKIKGLGKVQKFLFNDFIFEAFDKKFYYKSTIEGSYDLLLIGKSNEPETHILFDRLFPNLEESTFVDVGGSVGEFVNLASTFMSVKKIYAFEPRPDCSWVLEKNTELNNEDRIEVLSYALSDNVGSVSFNLNSGGSSSSILNDIRKKGDDVLIVNTELLDHLVTEIIGELVILIDVEGAELNVLKGAKEIIKNYHPLIIFEYNATSKKFFNLDQIIEVFGENYIIKRISVNGDLDEDFQNSWNCIAIPRDSVFSKILL